MIALEAWNSLEEQVSELAACHAANELQVGGQHNACKDGT